MIERQKKTGKRHDSVQQGRYVDAAEVENIAGNIERQMKGVNRRKYIFLMPNSFA